MNIEALFSSLTVANSGIWAIFGLLSTITIWWIRGMPDRKRAETDAKEVADKSSGAQFERLEKEIERLTERVNALEKMGQSKDQTIADLTAHKLEMLAERAADKAVASAVVAEKDAVIASLRAQIMRNDDVARATTHVAEETNRVANAAERANGEAGK